MITIAVVQRKGGVGKTTIATHLAAGWALKGYRVCLIDTDSQGDAARMVGMAPTDGLYRFIADDAPLNEVLKPVGSSAYSTPDHPPAGALFILPSSARTYAIPSVTDNPFILADRMKEFDDLFDIAVIDTAPTLSALDAYVYLASDYFIYVTECEALSAAGLEEGLRHIQRFSKHRETYIGFSQHVLGIIPNKLRASTGNHRANLELITEQHGSLVWSPLVLRTKWTEASSFGQLIYSYAPGSYEAREALRLVDQAEEAVKRVTA